LTISPKFSIIHLSQLKFKTMIVYEFTMKGNGGKDIHYLTTEQDVAEMDGQDTIIKWESNFAPEEYQNDNDECRLKAKEAGYSYCNGLGWVKLLKQL
jgi:hypothetical protein